MARKLTNLTFNRIDLCKMGANFDKATGDGSHILLMKSAPSDVDDAARGGDSAKPKKRKKPKVDADEDGNFQKFDDDDDDVEKTKDKVDDYDDDAKPKKRRKPKVDADDDGVVQKDAMVCPNCGAGLRTTYKSAKVARVEGIELEHGEHLMKYCPGCGARISLAATGGEEIGDQDLWYKNYDPEEHEVTFSKKPWTSKYKNNLPNSSYAHVDEDGKGHLPYKDASGKVDLAHLRNALARLNQTNISSADKAKARKRLEAAAKQHGVGVKKTADGRIVLVAISELDVEDTMTEQEIAKSIEDAVAKAVAAANVAKDKEIADLKKSVDEQKQAADVAAAVAKTERDARVTSEMRDTLKVFKNLPVNLNGEAGKTDVDVFKALQEKAPEQFPRVIELLKAADHAISQGKVKPFHAVGKSLSEKDTDLSDGAMDKIEKAADELVTAGKAPTRERAIAMVMKSMPDLVREYEQEFKVRKQYRVNE